MTLWNLFDEGFTESTCQHLSTHPSHSSKVDFNDPSFSIAHCDWNMDQFMNISLQNARTWLRTTQPNTHVSGVILLRFAEFACRVDFRAFPGLDETFKQSTNKIQSTLVSHYQTNELWLIQISCHLENSWSLPPSAKARLLHESTSWLHCRYKIHILWPKLDLPASPPQRGLNRM